ncbi:MAG: PrsW family intramembrane metalloprotease [Nocardioidaceae bacterium]
MPSPPPWVSPDTLPPAGRRTSWLVVLASIVLGLGAVVVIVLIVVSGGPEAALVGFSLAAIPVPFLVASFLWLDRYEPEPWRYVITALGWGAVMATTLGAGFTAVGSYLSSTGGTLETVIWAPLAEEFAKGLFILVVVLFRRREVDGLLDGIVYAGMVGIGFAFTENVLYYMASYSGLGAQTGGLVPVTALFVVRGVIGPFAHPLFTSAIGIGLGLALQSRSWLGRVLWPLLGFVAAVGLHALWNASAVTGGGSAFLVTYVVAIVPALGLVLGLALWARRREGHVLTASLADCARLGWLHPAEIPWISSLSYRRSARAYAHRHGGPLAARAVKEYQQAVAELGFLHARVMRGRAPRDAAAMQAEIRQRMAGWRPFVVLPPPLPEPPPRLGDAGMR